MKLFLWIIGMTSLSFTAFANGLVISNLVMNQAAQEVTFDVQWNNSWRFDGLAAPQNWDAVWLFVKFRGCEDCALSLDWGHGTIDGPSSSFGTLQPHSTAAGNQYYADRLGVMLRRPTTGIFPNEAASTITLKVDNLPITGSVELRVVGIEMVFVPQGAFELGDGGSTSSRFHEGGNNSTTFPIMSENAITFSNSAGNLYAVGSRPCCSGVYTIPASFPKGFDGFYMMKYEITGGQYATFLNTIPENQAIVRYTGNYGLNRNRLRDNGTAPNQYYAERVDRAQNYLSPNDLLSYLDWAALRPMTELEYEKAARGTATPIANEYAWGNIILQQAQVISPAANENGTELISTQTDANCAYGSFSYTGGDYAISANFADQRGPLRVGIFANPFDDSRATTGASFYGLMELSGNVYELTVGIIDIQSGNTFERQYGDGYLNSSASHDTPSWPIDTDPESNIMYRGGSWSDFSNNNLRISNRAVITNSLTTRSSNRGGRGGR